MQIEERKYNVKVKFMQATMYTFEKELVDLWLNGD